MTAPAPINTFHLPTLSLQTALPASPRTRSQSLSAARSPLSNLPNPFDAHIQHPKTVQSPHRRGISLHNLPFVASEDHLPSLGLEESSVRLLRGGVDEDDEASGGAEGVEAGRKGSVQYEGPFQAPDRKEMFGMVLSFGAVAVLAVAAGLTTIYDWVL